VNNGGDDHPQLPGLRDVSASLPKVATATPTQMRVIQAAVAIQEDRPSSIVYQHTVLCQTCLPYRDPGDQVRTWDRQNGKISLRVRAGEAHHPEQGWIEVGLPFGPKPRLILGYLNTQALLRQSPVIEVEDSLTAFVKRIGIDPNGRSLRTIKDQLARLAAADLRFGVPTSENSARTFKGQIVSEFDLWFGRDERQRVLWPSSVRLDAGYFESLMAHAVPLDERALGALSHSAMALDLYAWLAQRLHRIHPREDAFITWAAVRDQFGFGYANMRKFKQVFRTALDQVLAVYPDARLSLDGRGLTARHSRPPVARRLVEARKTAIDSDTGVPK
jgi:hypothetical protein